MGAINGIIHTAMLILGAVVIVLGGIAGLYFYFTLSGQEEGE